MHVLHSANGKYFHSFFTIYTDTSIKPEEYIKAGLTETIIHEYIHFLQDISTVFGLINFTDTISDISSFYNIEETQIKLPYRFKNRIIRETNKDLFSVYFSECELFSLPKDGMHIQFDKIPVSEFGMDGFPELRYYDVTFTKNKYSKNFTFGAQAILEGMAYLLETHLFNKQESKNWLLPYNFPELIAAYIFPEFSLRRDLIVALCDISLMFYHPAEAFVETLYNMKLNKYIPNAIDDVYDYVKNNFQIPKNNFDTIWINAVSRAINDIKNIVNVNEYNTASDWAIDNIEYFYKLRQQKMSFLTELMKCPPDNARVNLYNIFKKFTSPVIYNKNMEFAIIGGYEIPEESHSQLIYWYNLSKFYEYLFRNDKVKCPFIKFCELNDKCSHIEVPWERRGEGFCFYQQFSRMFGLYKREIIV
ncbi:MAG: hypothetical protein FWD40_06950 [Treponema sp.]|nr:hypothetical protein [Treponema sp.]